MPVTAVDLSCRLPVVITTGGGDYAQEQGGFLKFPGAQLTMDPAGVIRSRYFEQDFATVATPVLFGDGSPFYDVAQSRWVPAPAAQSLPDGSGYAYVATNFQTQNTRAYVVDVRSGRVRAFNLPTPERARVADYGSAGVYLMSYSALGGPGEGVWLMNSATGAVRLLRQLHQVWTIRDGYAWVARLDSRDKTAWGPMEIAPADSLVRVDLTTGAETVWYYRAGVYPWFEGLDSRGRPLVMVGRSAFQNDLRLIDRPGSPGELVYTGRTSSLGPMQGDGDRLWFGGPHGIYLYRPGQGLQKVYAYDNNAPNALVVAPAGFCL